ncbi:MAG: glycine radical domain-containing protein [Chloroflexota bacterium]|nr:glycine radical domain-containing protein [Chloroflexota bacterium]
MAMLVENRIADSCISCMYTFVNLSIHNIQFNVLDKQIFLDPQQHPENHGDLGARVVGFNSHFIDLTKEIQS